MRARASTAGVALLGLWLAQAALVACGRAAPSPAPTTSAPRSQASADAPSSAGVSAATPTPASPANVALHVRSTVKVEQLLGDADKHLRRPTEGQTLTQFGVAGADLGYPFELDGKVVFLFGDTIGTEGQNGADAIGFTTATDPERGVALSFYTRPDGKFLPFRPRGPNGAEQRLMGFEVPVAGIRLGAETFVAYKDHHNGDEDGSKDPGAGEAPATDITSLARFDAATGAATTLCELSRQPAGHYQKIAFHLPIADAGLPPGGPWVLMAGSGRHRASHAYLAIVPQASFASCTGIRHFVRLEGNTPVWSEHETEAQPVFRDGSGNGTIGEVSLTWAADIGRWLLFYDAKEQGARKIMFRYASSPWGPWSEAAVVFDPKRAGFGVFIHDASPDRDDGQAGPMIGKHKDHPEDARGAVYAPFVVERWTRVASQTLHAYFVMSIWNPYVVVLMHAEIDIARN